MRRFCPIKYLVRSGKFVAPPYMSLAKNLGGRVGVKENF
jgi:hypothetical protein